MSFLRFSLLIFCVSLGLQSSLLAQAATMVRGAHSSFMVGAPEGWMLNNRVAAQFNVPVAITSKDPQAWPGVLFYVASVPKGPGASSLAAYLVTYRSQLERPGSPLVVTRHGDLKGGLGATAQVYYFSGLATRRLEANAFFENKDSIDMVVLSAPNQEMFTQALTVFSEVVRTYGNEALKPRVAEPVEPAEATPSAPPTVRRARKP